MTDRAAHLCLLRASFLQLSEASQQAPDCRDLEKGFKAGRQALIVASQEPEADHPLESERG